MNKVFDKAVNFLKSIWNKYYNFIQWTKKWHFFHYMHIVLLGGYIVTFIDSTYELIYEYAIGQLQTLEELLDIINFGLDYVRFFYPVLFLITVIICLCLSVVIIFIKLCMEKPIFVTNKFVLSNKFYNFSYIFIHTLTIFINILVVCS